MKAVKIIVAILVVTIFASTTLFAQKSNPKTEETSETVLKEAENSVILFINSPIAYVNNKEMYVDKQNKQLTPVILDNRTLVPLRFVSEAFNATVSWEQSTKTASVALGKDEISFKQDETAMYVNGVKKQMDTAAANISNSTFVPLRFLAEALNKQVFYEKGLIVISSNKVDYDKKTVNALISKVNKLPSVETKQNLEKLVLRLEPEHQITEQIALEDEVLLENSKPSADNEAFAFTTSGAKGDSSNSAPAPNAAPEYSGGEAMKETASSTSASGLGDDFSKTNVQVEGVDEGDIIKTDGNHIYYVRNNTISVIEAKSLEVLYDVKYEIDSFFPSEIYVDKDKLVVIGNSSQALKSHYYKSITTAFVYDISNRADVKKLREVSIDGNYTSSRKIGNSIYIVTNNWLGSMNDLPLYKDSNIKDEFIELDCKDIYYFPDVIRDGYIVDNNYITVAGFTLDGEVQEVKVNSYLGAGHNIYASQDSLYIAATNFYDYYTHITIPSMGLQRSPEALIKSSASIEPLTETPELGIVDSAVMPELATADLATSSSRITNVPSFAGDKTTIYKFSLSPDDGNVTYLFKGEINGTVLNQFSMDEHNGFFRVATTYGDSNNLFVLNDALSVVGEITNIAPNERIYSARFMGNRAYMVTFRTVDPLFAIDLEDPYNPKILGALKIPGYSDYLHPYDENHLIGFGKDTTTIKDSAYYLGMKMSMFDVSDVSNPKELFVEYIGDRGTNSPLLYNHRALLFSKERNILAFPVDLFVKPESKKGNELEHGEFKFQGAFVYSIDMQQGFKLQSKISHLNEQDMLKSGIYENGNYEKHIQRILYIGDNLYTLSNKMIKSNSLKDFSEINSTEFKD